MADPILPVPLPGQPSDPNAAPQQAFPGQFAANQTEVQSQLAQFAAMQQQVSQQQATTQPQAQGPDKSHGWSLTNPFQDIGQVWHDVETHTVSPIFHATHWLYENAVARPLSTMMMYQAHQITSGNMSFFQGSNWAKSWNTSAHISPGQALVIDMTDSPIIARYGQGYNPAEMSQGPGIRFIDPLDDAQRGKFQSWASNQWGGKISTGSADAAIGWYGDPTQHLTKATKFVKAIKDVPVSRADTEAQAVNKLNAPASKRFDTWAVGKPISQIAEHPLVKGATSRLNPYRYQMAALIAGAKSSDDVNLIRQVAAGLRTSTDVVARRAGDNLDQVAGQVTSSDKALDKMAQTNQDLAVQASNLFMPPETMEKYALSASSSDEKSQFLQKASQMKAHAAQVAFDADPETANQILQLHGAMRGRTTTNAITNRLAELRGNMKYRNTRNTDGLSFWQKNFYNFPVRIYQGLTDRVEGLINHREDDAVEVARSWLNKSTILTAEDKNDLISRYASALPPDRQRVWNDVENEVYNKVGAEYGIEPDLMQRVLTSTRATASGYFDALAKGRAYGTVPIANEEHAVLPTADSEVILHPKLITQLEQGAVPMANLKTLENALEQASRTDMLDKIVRSGYNVGDQILNLLEKVYGIWKPMSLITGHRAYNHIGDDWLRGAARLGAMTTINNAAEGGANFLRNMYARATKNQVVRNIEATHEVATAHAKAEYEGLKAQWKSQQGVKNIPDDLKIKNEDVVAKRAAYTQMKNLKLDYIPPIHRLGTGTFKIAGSNLDWTEAFGGPNGDWARLWTSSHPTWGSLVDDAAHRTHSIMTAIRTRNFGTIRAVDDVARHTRAYVHYVRNQLMPDPVGKMIVQGRDLNDVARWLATTSQGHAHMKALHIGDVNDHVNTVAEMVKTYLPYDGMRDDAAAGKFNASTIEAHMPNPGSRPDIHANINTMVHGGDPLQDMFKRSVESIMKWTGTMPDDIMVRHPVFNSLYKSRLTDDVQSWMAKTGESTISNDMVNLLQRNAMLGARKDMQGLVYDVSRFNDLGHTLRFVSPFFNAWFNAMTSWSKLFMENPTLLSRTYQAKRLLWNQPFIPAMDATTGKKADTNTPWDNTVFMVHLPKGLSQSLGGLNTVPIDAKTFISPTYLDSIGNPGFGPLVAVPANQIVKDHPSLMNDAVVRSMLNNIVDKNSLSQLLPSGARDMGTLSQILMGAPDSTQDYANTAWALYQEQMYDYLNGQRTEKPNWSDVQTQAKYLTVVDLVANRLMPLGFKPSAGHEALIDQYRQMQADDPKNARQNFYDKYGPAGMMYTQSLNTDPSGIPATVGASQAVKRYSSLLAQFPELGAVIVGPEGNGNFDQMAYDWQVANGLRQKLSPQDAAKQAMINIGWAQYGKVHAGAMAQLAARGLTNLNSPAARDIKAQVTNLVTQLGDPQDQQMYNPYWYANYTSFNQNDYQNRIDSLLQIAQDKTLLANPMRSDIRSLQAYSQLRDETFAALQKRTSHSLKAASNFDIAKSYDEGVAALMHDDTKFGQLYERYLAKDDFKEPTHG